jgi:hypothetical protein
VSVLFTGFRADEVRRSRQLADHWNELHCRLQAGVIRDPAGEEGAGGKTEQVVGQVGVANTVAWIEPGVTSVTTAPEGPAKPAPIIRPTAIRMNCSFPGGRKKASSRVNAHPTA